MTRQSNYKCSQIIKLSLCDTWHYSFIYIYVWLFNDDINNPAPRRKCYSEKRSRQNEQVRSHGDTFQIHTMMETGKQREGSAWAVLWLSQPYLTL